MIIHTKRLTALGVDLSGNKEILALRACAEESCFEVLPLLVITQGIQHTTQPIIAPFLLAYRLSATRLQRVQSRGCPCLHLIHAMVTLGHNVRQPDRGRQAQARSLPVAMGLKVAIQQFCYPHFVTLRQQYRNIVHSFCRHRKLFFHTASLSQFHNLVTI